MSEPSLTAESFAAAAGRLAAYRDRTVVVKLGGSAMEEPAATDACLRSVNVLSLFGVRVALVHGGGKPIDRAMAAAGLTPRKVAGRRYTDADTLAVVVRVLGEINSDLVQRADRIGTRVRGYYDNGAGSGDFAGWPLTGARLSLTDATGAPVDLGHVGTVTGVAVNALRAAHQPSDGRDPSVPILPSLARDASGGWLNINADTAASAVAGVLKADMAVFLTDTPGVLRDRSDPRSLISKLTEAEARGLIASGVINGGMVPKVEACFEALEAGAKSALILDGRVPYSLLDVFLKDTFTGTVITR
ncbi:Acetylglutamate kinase [Gemmata obscuriglobus]|uniref:Acetylglutamate kinase n=1 Tax=Gemmata obscuriglobus TaxID=114 RepID=A0A2Z3H4D7_9BACT|nr:acetylglutamate kinase [Gemmata obscuriglobus]AWM37975.1 acetylglutamate kinase [Gemmata obscuriglobus]QEG29164.1 Acetylglutamate kinase [Gemmata obscuriglobus]VTS07903.1 acetylglutamate kinase : Acetylglutamate kinase OS=Singulisphaera acidiphila (strain ATCC BAA-1392 / DSM 18658 / VKM B-2454 / MOB10) GN=argB PE=3 SV=1: AA_kinase [Gemmata obscuriglobus UQM 2246]